jgi:hypothetical protein
MFTSWIVAQASVPASRASRGRRGGLPHDREWRVYPGSGFGLRMRALVVRRSSVRV